MQNASLPSDLSDAQWILIEPLLPRAKRLGRPRTCLRAVLDAIVYVLKSGCQWRMLPPQFPPWQTVYTHFRSFTLCGFWRELNDLLREDVRRQEGRDFKPSASVLDSQSVRSGGHGGEVGYDAGKKVKGRKRFILVDVLGMLLGVNVCPADRTERDGAKVLLADTLHRFRTLRMMWVDGGFSGEEFSKWVGKQSSILKVEVIKRIEGTKGFEILPRRWVVERTFGWLMQNRRLVRDHECTEASAVARIHLCMIRLMIRRLAK